MSEPMKYEKGATVRQYHNSTRLRYDDAVIKFAHQNGALDVIGLDGTAYGWSVDTCEVIKAAPVSAPKRFLAVPVAERQEPVEEIHRLRNELELRCKELDLSQGWARAARTECAQLRERQEQWSDLLVLARQFVVNGIELGYVQMPDDDTPDPAHDLVPKISAALAAGPVPIAKLEPVAQRQGEPIMLTAVATLEDDGDGGLEPRWLLEGDTAELFAGMLLLVADNAPGLCEEDGSAEVYTHADPGEVERLKREIDHLKGGGQLLVQDRDELRARLAERGALLCDIEKRHWSGVDFDLPSDLVARIKALSASAEQKCSTCQGYGVVGWTTGQTPESFDQGEAPCEDCGATGYAQSNGMPVSGTCTTCNGLGTVPDGEITGMGGVEFDNGPIKCVKDCPDCAAVACRLPEPEQLHEAIAGALGEALDCTRVWAAWGVGTMSEDDFTPVAGNQERLHEIATACLAKIKESNQ